MKTLQEKILEIKKFIDYFVIECAKEDHCQRCDDARKYSKSLKEITTLIEEGYYEKDFVEFTRTECEGMNEGWQYYKKVNSIQYFGTTDELYEHWQKEIRTSN